MSNSRNLADFGNSIEADGGLLTAELSGTTTFKSGSTTMLTVEDGAGLTIVNSPTWAMTFGTNNSELLLKAGGNNDIRFMTNDENRMYIKNDGDVGIGTSSPNDRLVIQTGDDASGSQIRLGNQEINIIDRYLSNDYSARIWASWPGYGILRFGINDGSGAVTTSDLTIRGSGNVGINTDDPQRKLHVKGTVEEVIRVESGTTGAIHFFEGASRRGILGYSNGGSISSNASAGDTVLRTETGTKLHLAISGYSKLIIDSSGRVTKPDQPFFHAYGSGQTAVSSGSSLFAFSNTYDNIGSHYNTSNSRFTAPVAGRYLFSYMARVDGADVDYFRSFIRINGSGSYTVGHIIKDLGTNWDPRFYSFTGTAIYDLAANDYVEIVTNSNSDSYTQYNSESSFYGYLLG